MKLPFRIFWHLTATVLVGLFCFAAGRTSGIRDCQKDYLLQSHLKGEATLKFVEDAIIKDQQ